MKTQQNCLEFVSVILYIVKEKSDIRRYIMKHIYSNKIDFYKWYTSMVYEWILDLLFTQSVKNKMYSIDL